MFGAALLLAVCVAVATPWRLVDSDSLMRLSIGRVIVENHTVPSTDPFSFSDPHRRWGNPEWLGDILWYQAFRLGGEPVAIIVNLLFISLGWLLVMLWGMRLGSSSWLMAILLIFVLPSSIPRLTLRNQIHIYWLIPLTAFAVSQLAHTARVQWLLALCAVGVLWANLHGSFVLGWAIVAASVAAFFLSPQTDRAPQPGGRHKQLMLGALVLQPFLVLVSPHGYYNYQLLFDHLFGVGIYTKQIAEWTPSTTITNVAAPITLHALSLIGLISFLPKPNRRHVDRFILLVVSLILAYSAQRFIPLLGILAGPGIAANLHTWITPFLQRTRWAPIAVASSALCIVIVSIGLIASTTTLHQRPSVFQRKDAPITVAKRLLQPAFARKKLFNPFNAGPWLLWYSTPNHIRLYIDPRNNLGAAHLEDYVTKLLRDPHEFSANVAALDIHLALVDLSDGRMTSLNRFLEESANWKLVFFDGYYALYARDLVENQPVIEQFRYTTIRAQLNFEYLLNVPTSKLEVDQRRLVQDGPVISSVLDGYLLLTLDGALPPLLPSFLSLEAEQRTRHAQTLLSKALPQLPPSDALLTYLATAAARLNELDAAKEILAIGRSLFPQSPLLCALALEIAKKEDNSDEKTKYTTELERLAPPSHVIWKILSGSRR